MNEFDKNIEHTLHTKIPGICVPHPPIGSGYRTMYYDWCLKREWCKNQGWIQDQDYLLPGVMENAKWYFKTEKQATLFVLKWA